MLRADCGPLVRGSWEEGSVALLRLQLVICMLALCGCALTPAEPYRVESFAYPPAETGVLSSFGSRIEAELDGDESAFWLLEDAKFALDARLALLDHAESTLDIQYFIVESSPTGRLFARHIIAAAERGVRVRLLLDDLTLSRRDWEYVALQQHPLIEVRSFNPWKGRHPLQRVFEFFAKPKRLNRRMHIKTVLADGQVAMIGGRNIGDRYFGLYDVFVQNDLDIMTVGPTVGSVIDSFDEYWNHPHSYPVTVIARPGAKDRTLAEFESLTEDSVASIDAFPVEPTDWRPLLDTLSRSFAVGTGRLSYDPPDFARAAEPRELRGDLMAFLRSARDSVSIVTAYLVPDDEFMALVEELKGRGVSVRIVTNSLATNNHMLAHTSYRRWRRRLIAAGVELYELRADADLLSIHSLPENDAGFLGLHSKAAVVDDRRAFVGSPNIDPRSLNINLEIGYFVEGEELAARLQSLIDRNVAPENAWRVTMDSQGWLKWTNSDETVTRQPALGFKQRLMEFFINMLPLKKQA